MIAATPVEATTSTITTAITIKTGGVTELVTPTDGAAPVKLPSMTGAPPPTARKEGAI